MPRKQGGRKAGRKGRGKNKGKQQQSKQNDSLDSTKINKAQQEQIKERIKKQTAEAKERETYIGLDIGSSFIKVAAVVPIATCEKNSKNDNDSGAVTIPETIDELSNILCNNDTFNQYFHKRINILADDSGQHSIPCVVTYLQDRNSNSPEILVGGEAIKSSIKNNKNCIYHVKELLSMHYSDCKETEEKEEKEENDEKLDEYNQSTVEFDVDSMEQRYRKLSHFAYFVLFCCFVLFCLLKVNKLFVFLHNTQLEEAEYTIWNAWCCYTTKF